MRIAVVGATGLVGREMLTVLAERGFGNDEIIASASERSVGKEIAFANRTLTVQSVNQAIKQTSNNNSQPQLQYHPDGACDIGP